MLYDFMFPLAGVVNGIAISLLNYKRLRNGRTVPCLLLSVFIANIAVIDIFNQFDLASNGLQFNDYPRLGIVTLILFGYNSVAMDFCYVLRLRALVRTKIIQKYVWLYLLCPLVNVIIYLIIIATTVNPDLGVTKFTRNLLDFAFLWQSLTHLCSHLSICVLFYNALKRMNKINGEFYKIIAPGCASLLYFFVGIWGFLGPSIGNGPVCFVWALDCTAFVIVNELFERLFKKKMVEKEPIGIDSIVNSVVESNGGYQTSLAR